MLIACMMLSTSASVATTSTRAADFEACNASPSLDTSKHNSHATFTWHQGCNYTVKTQHKAAEMLTCWPSDAKKHNQFICVPRCTTSKGLVEIYQSTKTQAHKTLCLQLHLLADGRRTKSTTKRFCSNDVCCWIQKFSYKKNLTKSITRPCQKHIKYVHADFRLNFGVHFLSGRK